METGLVKTVCSIHPYMSGSVRIGEASAAIEIGTSPAERQVEPNVAAAEVREFVLPVKESVPSIAVVDAEDNVWFTMGGGGWGNIALPPLSFVGRLTIDGEYRQYQLPSKAAGSSGVSVSKDGIICVTELMAGKIGKLDWKRQKVEEITLRSEPAWPTGLSFDAEGNLWFSMTRANKIGCLSPDGSTREFPVPTLGGHPTGIAVDSYKNVWSAE